MSAESDELAAIRTEMAHLKRHPPQGGQTLFVALLTAAVGLATVLITLGKFALAPVERHVEQMREEHLRLVGRINHIREGLAHHDEDGHPTVVIDRIEEVKSQHIVETGRLRKALHRHEERLDKMAVSLADQHRRIEERSKYFERLMGEKAQDRWTGSEEKVYQRQHELRHKLIEEGRLKPGVGRGLGRLKE